MRRLESVGTITRAAAAVMGRGGVSVHVGLLLRVCCLPLCECNIVCAAAAAVCAYSGRAWRFSHRGADGHGLVVPNHVPEAVRGQHQQRVAAQQAELTAALGRVPGLCTFTSCSDTQRDHNSP